MMPFGLALSNDLSYVCSERAVSAHKKARATSYSIREDWRTRELDTHFEHRSLRRSSRFTSTFPQIKNKLRASASWQDDTEWPNIGIERAEEAEHGNAGDGRVATVVLHRVVADDFFRVTSPLQSPSNGFRVDPFGCIPGCRNEYASMGIDYRECPSSHDLKTD